MGEDANGKPNTNILVAPQSCTMDGKCLRLSWPIDVVPIARPEGRFAWYRVFAQVYIGHVMQMVGNSSAQDFKDSFSVGTGETHVFNTEYVLLSNERLERSSPVL